MNKESEVDRNAATSAAVALTVSSAPAALRPTEAQLRWAQFHHKRRAAAIRERLLEWYQTPESPHDVEGAVSDDGNSSVSTNVAESTETSQRQNLTPPSGATTKPAKNKVRISKGRRALLRVSKRRYTQRKEWIAERGFRGDRGSGVDDSEEELEGMEDGLAAIFAEESWWRKKRKKQRRRKKGAPAMREDLDRIKRFEEAFHSMMMALAARQAPQHEVITATRVWKRSMEPADLDFTQWKLPSKASHANTQSAAHESMSRGYPLTSRGDHDRCTSTDGVYRLPESNAYPPTSTVPRQPLTKTQNRMTCRELVDALQQQLEQDSTEASAFIDVHLQVGAAPSATPRRVLDKFFRPAGCVEEKKEDGDGAPMTPACNDPDTNQDEEDALLLMQQYWPEVHESSDLLQELEDAQPGLSKQLFQLFLQDQAATPYTARRQLLAAARRHMELHALEFLGQQSLQQSQTSNLTPEAQPGLTVHQLIARLESTLRHEPRIWQDGRLHKPEFAKIVRDYLREAQPAQLRSFKPNSRGTAHERTKRHRKLSRSHLNPITLVNSRVSDDDDEPEEDDPFERVLREQQDEESIGSDEVEDYEGGAESDVSADDTEVFVERLVRQLSSEELVDSRGHVTERFRTMVAQYLQQAQENYSTVRRAIFEVQSSELEPNFALEEDPPIHSTPALDDDAKHFVHEFVKQLEKSSKIEPVFTRDGKVVKPALEKFVLRYIQQTAETPKTNTVDFFLGVRSPEALARARQQSARKSQSHQNREHGGPCPVGLGSPRTQRKFVQILQTKVEANSGPTGARSGAEMEELVESALLEAVVENHRNKKTQQQQSTAMQEPLFDDLDDFVQPFVTNLSLHLNSDLGKSYRTRNSPQVNNEIVRQLVESSLPPSVRPCAGVFVDRFVTEFVDSFRKSFDGVLDLPVMHSIARTSAESAAIEYSLTNSPSETTASENETGYGPRDTTLTKRIAGTVSEKIVELGGFLAWNQHADQNGKEGELQAVAAFRKSRLHNSSTDDTSSLSSFRVPEGFKKVVQTFRRGGAASRESTVAGVSARPGEMPDAAQKSANEPPNSHDQLDPSRSLHRLRNLQEKVLERSSRLGDDDEGGSIIDTDGTEVSYSARDPAILSNLLLSPTILTKRLQQAIRAVEARNWDQVAYLMSANPWLAEMTDLATNQFLLHKVALYGSDTQSESSPCPGELNADLIRMFPSAVHKFDRDGNLPLHMAAASANLPMIQLLGDRFPSGASVRNEDGMLPLHLAILALASRDRESNSLHPDVRSGLVKAMLRYFPGAVTVTDNDGNLPLHSAVNVLRDDIGVDVVYSLMDEAERQVKLGATFRNKVKIKAPDSASIGTETADSMHEFDEEVLCSLVRNDDGETPLMAAIRSRAGWKLIEALVAGPGGVETVLCQDADLNNALHLLVSDNYSDPKAVMSILKVAPEAARVRNASNMIPIEIACRHDAPREVLLAIALVDLPFDLDDSECLVSKREGCGASWFFLTCECDDAQVDVVEEVLSLCTYPQIRELCFFDVGLGETLLARATPKCRLVLQRSLRFLGRFEFVAAQSEDTPTFRVFEAIDYGTKEFPIVDGLRVVLKCYIDHDCFERESTIIRQYDLDFSLLEEVCLFAVGEDGMTTNDSAKAKQYCISIEQPNLTLEGVLEGMLGNNECRSEPTVRKRYAEKVFAVLRIAAKALRHLHSLGLVHGSVNLKNCAKYGSRWKLGNVLQFCEDGVNDIGPPSDVWSFGMLSYEVLVGEPLFSMDDQDNSSLGLDWSRRLKLQAHQKLVQSFVPVSWADMIVSCLDPAVDKRPTMNDVLALPLWKDTGRRQR